MSPYRDPPASLGQPLATMRCDKECGLASMQRHADRASGRAAEIVDAVRRQDTDTTRKVLDEVCSSLLELTRHDLWLATAATHGRDLLLTTYRHATPYVCFAMRLLPDHVERFIVEVERAHTLRSRIRTII